MIESANDLAEVILIGVIFGTFLFCMAEVFELIGLWWSLVKLKRRKK
jgi:hypothetical protein